MDFELVREVCSPFIQCGTHQQITFLTTSKNKRNFCLVFGVAQNLRSNLHNRCDTGSTSNHVEFGCLVLFSLDIKVTILDVFELAYGPTEGGFFYSSNAISTPEHGGTHLDAPIHFAEGRWTSDQIPLEALIGPAVVLDVSDRALQDADYRLTADDVGALGG